MPELRDRIAQLSAESRRRLIDALVEQSSDGSDPNTSLVAYLVGAQDQHPEAHELREHVKRSLPDYMVPSSFVFLESMPRTPNGKVAVDELPAPAATSAPGTDGPGFAAPQTEVEQTLVDIWSRVLGIGEIGVHDNFFEIGGDSILSIRIVALAREAGISVTPDLLFDHQTIASLAQVVTFAAEETGSARKIEDDAAPQTPIPLTPIQHWFFEQGFDEPNHWNQSVVVQSRGAVRFDWLQRAVDALAEAHPLLRARFLSGDGERMCVISTDRLPVDQVDLTSTPEVDRAAMVAAKISTAEASLDIEHGPIVRVTLFDSGGDTAAQIHLAAHHLVVDVLSWQKLVDDLSSAYRQARAEGVVRLEPPPATFRAWSAHLAGRANAADLSHQLSYWLDAAATHAYRNDPNDPNDPNDLNAQPARFTEASVATVEVVLDSGATSALLTQVPGVYGTQIDEVLLAALASSTCRWVGREKIRIGLERHGRETPGYDIDVSETVGWFTSYFPVTLEAHGQAPLSDPGGLLKAVKEQLRAVPEKGLVFGIGRYLAVDEDIRTTMQSIPDPTIIFNYAGRMTPPDDDSGEGAFWPIGGFRSSRSPLNHRNHQLEVNAFVADGSLTIRWQYGASMFTDTTIEQLASSMRADLESLIDHCLSKGAGGYTPSDFPDIDLDQDDLDQLLDSL